MFSRFTFFAFDVLNCFTRMLKRFSQCRAFSIVLFGQEFIARVKEKANVFFFSFCSNLELVS